MKVKHSEIFESRISDVWRVMTDLNDYAWRSDISRIEVFEQGNKFTEISTGGVETRFIVTDFQPVTRYAFSMENENFVGDWTGELSESGGKTLAVFTENIRPKRKILIVPAYVYMRLQQKTYFRDLKRALHETE